LSAQPHGLRAGRVGRAHGLDGSFYVTAADPRLLNEGTKVLIGADMRTIVRRAGASNRPIIRLQGVEDRASAEALRGSDLFVDSAVAPALEEGEWWAHELEGCEVFAGQRHVGTVVSLLGLPSCEVLQVRRAERRADGGEDQLLLVPMVKDAIRAVDTTHKRIEVDLAFLGELETWR
jgi:16S rRNA processing protein RimM